MEFFEWYGNSIEILLSFTYRPAGQCGIIANWATLYMALCLAGLNFFCSLVLMLKIYKVKLNYKEHDKIFHLK